MTRRDGAWGVGGGTGFALLVLLFRGRLEAMGYPSDQAHPLALALGLEMALAAGAVFPLAALERHGGLVALAMGGGGLVVAGGLFSLAWGLSFDAFLAGAGIVVAVGLLTTGIAALVMRLGKYLAAGRLAGALTGALLLAGPFVTGPLARSSALAAWKPCAKIAAVWLSPGMLVSTAMAGLDFARLPATYALWLGPLAPYPSSPWIAVAVYGASGLALHGLARGLRRGKWQDVQRTVK